MLTPYRWFQVTSSPPCWWTKTKDLSLAPFVRPPAIVHWSIVICVSRDWLQTIYLQIIKTGEPFLYMKQSCVFYIRSCPHFSERIHCGTREWIRSSINQNNLLDSKVITTVAASLQYICEQLQFFSLELGFLQPKQERAVKMRKRVSIFCGVY